jgi:hypothetical protein
MELIKSLELEILLTLRNNKAVPVSKFSDLFEQNWNRYQSGFNELKAKGLFKVSTQIPGICTYQLNRQGDHRIMELLTERAKEIEIRLTQLNQIKHKTPGLRWNTLSGILRYLKRSPVQTIQSKSA